MLRRTFIALFAGVTFAPAGFAADESAAEPVSVQVGAAQIQHLLSGNTIIGTWSGSAYRQYFDANGITIYIAEGRPPSRGKWRVNEGTDAYESWWEQTGWTPYKVMMTNEGFAWVNRDRLEPFEVHKGRQGGF